MSVLDGLPSGFDRHADALLIVDPGASNPSGVARTLHHACRQVIAEGGRQADDPAVRLMGLQLAFLLGVGGAIDPHEYARLVDACRARAGERPAAATA